MILLDLKGKKAHKSAQRYQGVVEVLHWQPPDLWEAAGYDTLMVRAEHMEANNRSAAVGVGIHPWLSPKLQLMPHSTLQINT